MLYIIIKLFVCRISKVEFFYQTLVIFHKDFPIEATSSQKVWAPSISTGDQGGEPTLSQ